MLIIHCPFSSSYWGAIVIIVMDLFLKTDTKKKLNIEKERREKKVSDPNLKKLLCFLFLFRQIVTASSCNLHYKRLEFDTTLLRIRPFGLFLRKRLFLFSEIKRKRKKLESFFSTNSKKWKVFRPFLFSVASYAKIREIAKASTLYFL